MAQVTLQTTRPRGMGTGVTVTVWRNAKAVEDSGDNTFKKGDALSEPTTVLVVPDRNGRMVVDEDVADELWRNGQAESFGLVRVK